MKEIEKEKYAIEQAKGTFEEIKRMLERAKHAETCDGSEDCPLTDKEIMEGLGYVYDGKELEDDMRDEYHDQEAIEDEIWESPLSVEVRSGWESIGEKLKPSEYQILMSTGGPAVRIVGDLNGYGTPTSAKLEYQDWGTPWTPYPLTYSENNTLLEFAQHFSF